MKLPSWLGSVVLGLATLAPHIAAQTSIPLDAFLKTGRTVHATLGGHPGTFLLDTGGGVTNITPHFAAAIGCKPWGQITGFTMTARRIDMQRCDHQTLVLGTTALPLETLGVFDSSSLMPPDAPPLDGTVALDAFAGRTLRFSYIGNTLTLLSPKERDALIGNRPALPLHLVRDAEGLALSVNLPVATPAGLAWFELDSGNTSPFTLVGEHLASLLNLRPATPDIQTLHTTLADGTPVDSNAKVLNLTLDGNLGTAFLAHHDVLLDLAHAHIWLLPASSSGTGDSSPRPPSPR